MSTKPQDFKKTVQITSRLLEDLKQGRTKLRSGQWMYSTRDKQKVKYIGTYYKVDPADGVIKPIVKLSSRQPGQTIEDWNKSFRFAKQSSEEEERKIRSLIKRFGKVNGRTEFTKADDGVSPFPPSSLVVGSSVTKTGSEEITLEASPGTTSVATGVDSGSNPGSDLRAETPQRTVEDKKLTDLNNIKNIVNNLIERILAGNDQPLSIRIDPNGTITNL